MVTFSVNKDIYKAMPKVTKLNLNPTKQNEQEWLSEAFIKILEGKKDIGTVELSAYAKICERVSALERAKAGEVPMLYSNETLMGYEGIQADLITDIGAVKAFDEVEANADMQYYINYFKSMRATIYREEGSDIWYLLNHSMQDKKEAHSKIRALAEEYRYLKEVITFVIKNPACYSALDNMFEGRVKLAS
jgi:hypothetical protein